MDEQEIHACLSRWRAGEEEAFYQIYAYTQQHVYRTVYFLAKNKQDVADMVSEIYIELLKSLGRYDDHQPFRSWLNGVIFRQCQNWHRKAWRKLRIFQKSRLLDIQIPWQDVETQIIQHAESTELLALVETLSYKLKAVIVLRYYHDYTFEEISEILAIPQGTVKSRHHAALQKLRQLKGRIKRVAKEASPYVN